MKRLSETISDFAPPLHPSPPAWALNRFVRAHEQVVGTPDAPVTSRRAGALTMLSGVVPDARALPAAQLIDTVASLYGAFAAELERQGRQAIRVWNFVPAIQERLEDGDRYMAFNAGRYKAYADWFGGPREFPATLPTASAVGIEAGGLSIYVLASSEAAEPIENPRQTPSYRYSRQYGVRPPCFSRASRLGSTLLIGGTASILGEHSRHANDIDAQTRETCRNIAAVIRTASPLPLEDPLDALVDVRVYIRDPHDAPSVRTLLSELAPGLPSAEFVQAALCRRELLVEIEGVAELNGLRH